MSLHHERPDYTYYLQAANGQAAKVNGEFITQNFIIAPNTLIKDWAENITPATFDTIFLEPIIALKPELIIIGTGEKQIFLPAKIMAFCLSQGVGFEIMNNSAAARTFNILASENRNIAAGFLFST